MKWETKDIDTYLRAKEYVDTAVIPLVPIVWGDEMKSTVAMGEFISVITEQLERQFQGRIVLLPPFTYTNAESTTERIKRLKNWHDLLVNGGFRHVILLTSDVTWKESEQQLEGTLIWMPTIPLEHLDNDLKHDVITEQIKQLIPILTNKWQNV